MFPLNYLNDKSRRDFLKLTSAGVFGASLSGWMNVLAARADESKPTKGKAKSCILLWMDGGPSHKDTFDLKPGSKGAGDFKPIKTSASGIEISEHFPKLAQWMNKAALVRGMSTPEGAHPRAKFNLHTGYREGQGGVDYPSIGAIASMELAKKEFPLPNYVAIGGRSFGSGFLGPKYAPLIVGNPDKGVEDLKSMVSTTQFDRRVGLLEEMEQSFFGNYQADNIIDHSVNYHRAVEMMKSKEAKAFDLSKESSTVRSAYGSGTFNDGCLMARRLVEIGVPFIEVTLGGWDTHQDNFDKVKNLSGRVDQAVSALLKDLTERRLLDSTLVIWMGEFGRTPAINTRGAKPGRDHYPKAWSLMMAGGGVPGGQVIGRTDKEGAIVEEGKTSAVDFLSTVCTLMGINYKKDNTTPNGRPVRVVDKAAVPIKQIVG
ncbi:DUF1501 domain-containing protein [Telmatocola sphagniphila]|uniref:DUF1501 domain-containing protein n=1 Tax=Telmatocola sphagniphila TaxID=1123043 RepID=A0A8E6ESJ9_9BACT|nr:DUF1501 domain-containing protein [Telmatocola sphagniphila]QVL30859.1 DUF1501 domain-containing protein [Telmatocola sphagniphila]